MQSCGSGGNARDPFISMANFRERMIRYYSLNRSGKESERDAGIKEINTMSKMTDNQLVAFKFK